MSTEANPISYRNEIGPDQKLQALVCALDADPFLFRPERLLKRLIALDELDAAFCNLNSGRAKALRSQLEAANAELYQSVRSEIVGEGWSRTLHQWMEPTVRDEKTRGPLPGLSFDIRDEIVSDVLQLREPSETSLARSPEMAPYQPTPVRHILDLIVASKLSSTDLLVDLGSGLGHVSLLVSILTGIRTLGVEVQSEYVASAQECAHCLYLSQAKFIAEDVRDADLSTGSVFYLYSPFTGSILTEVLRALRRESTKRLIKICSLGPCTSALANEPWLKANTRPDSERIAILEPR